MMNITLHQLTVLQAVKKQGSLTAAANALHITQPAISNILKQLECHCHYPLTETIGKRVFITEAGERLIKAADAIKSELSAAISDIDAMHGKVSGTMNVAIVSTAKYFFPKLLAQFRKQHPLVKIKLTVCNRQDALNILKDNASDFLIMSQPPTDVAVEKKLLYHDCLVVVASPEMTFKRTVKKLTDLADEEWVIREPGSGTRIVMMKLFKKHKMLPNISMEVGNNESIKQLIIGNLGISIVSKQSIELELQHNLMKIIPIDHFPIDHPWYFVMNKGKQINPVVASFFEFVKQYPFAK